MEVLTLELGPLLVENVEHEGLTSHGVLSCVACCTTEEHNLLLGDDRDRMTEARLRDLSVHFYVFDALIALIDDLGLGGITLAVFGALHDDVTAEPGRLLVGVILALA